MATSVGSGPRGVAYLKGQDVSGYTVGTDGTVNYPGTLYFETTAGQLYIDPVGVATPFAIGIGVTLYHVNHDNSVVFLQNNGNLYLFADPGPVMLRPEAPIGQNVVGYTVDASGTLYFETTAGQLYVDPVGVATPFAIGTGVTLIHLNPSDDSVVFLQNNGNLYIGFHLDLIADEVGKPVTLIGQNVVSYTVGTGGTLYFETTAGQLYFDPKGAAITFPIASGVTSYHLNPDDSGRLPAEPEPLPVCWLRLLDF